MANEPIIPEPYDVMPYDDQDYMPVMERRMMNMQLPELQANILKELLSTAEIPEEVKKEYWWAIVRDYSITFLDESRKAQKMMAFDIIRIDAMNNTPWYKYTFDVEMKWSIIRNIFETKLDRSLGTKEQGIKNERLTQQSQLSEQKISTEQNLMSGNPGFFSRLFGRKR